MDDVLVANLNARLASSGMRQSDLAATLGISRNAVSLWCRGAAEPRVSDLPRIAAALGVTASDLLRPETARGTASAVMSVPLRATVAPHDVIGSVAIPTGYGACADRYAVQITGRCIAVCVPLDWPGDDRVYVPVLIERQRGDMTHGYELGWAYRKEDGSYVGLQLFDHAPVSGPDVGDPSARLVARVELTIGSLDGLSL